MSDGKILGIVFLGSVPDPDRSDIFLNARHRAEAAILFDSEKHMQAYALRSSAFGPTGREEQPLQTGFDRNDEKIAAFIQELIDNPELEIELLGSADGLERWAALYGAAAHRLQVFGTPREVKEAMSFYIKQGSSRPVDIVSEASAASFGAFLAIFPLSGFLIFMLLVVVWEKLPRPDEL